jgi:hypothetical protein
MVFKNNNKNFKSTNNNNKVIEDKFPFPEWCNLFPSKNNFNKHQSKNIGDAIACLISLILDH